jgi:hypothetical protein
MVLRSRAVLTQMCSKQAVNIHVHTFTFSYVHADVSVICVRLLQMVRMLVEAGANVNACTTAEGTPALAHVLFNSKAEVRDAEILEILIAETASVYLWGCINQLMPCPRTIPRAAVYMPMYTACRRGLCVPWCFKCIHSGRK